MTIQELGFFAVAFLILLVCFWVGNAIAHTERFKSLQARYDNIFSVVRDFVYQSAVNDPARLAQYEVQSKESGVAPYILFIFDETEKVLAKRGIRVDLNEVEAIVRRVRISSPDFPDKVN